MSESARKRRTIGKAGHAMIAAAQRARGGTETAPSKPRLIQEAELIGGGVCAP